MNKSEIDGSFVTRSRSRRQIINNNFYLEQEPYLEEYTSYTLTNMAVIIQLLFGVLPKAKTLSKNKRNSEKCQNKNVMAYDT